MPQRVAPTSAPIEQTPEALRRNIASRKRFDGVFGLVGGILIFVSLLVLVALIVNLLKEGWGPLRQSHEVKTDQTGFGRKELAGTLRRSDLGWLLQLDTLTMKPSPAVKDQLPTLAGKPVGVRGKLPRGTAVDMEITAAKPLSEGGSFDLTGKLQYGTVHSRDGIKSDVIQLIPDPIKIDLGKISSDSLSDGARVAIDPAGKVSEMKLTAASIVPLETRTFFTSFPSRFPDEAGILSAWVGTLLIMLVTVVLAVPLGVMAGIYLEEYAPRNRFTALIEINIANLAGVPSIIWGLMALGLFIYILGFERSVMVAGMTLGLLVLPIVIIATREAIRAIPGTIREASVGLGATRWQTVRYHIVPYSMPGILTGSIIAMSRAIGETAPLVTIGALTFIAFLPPAPVEYRPSHEAQAAYLAAKASDPNAIPPEPQLHVQPFQWLKSGYTVMPIQLFQWVSRPQKEFHQNAAAAGIVLLAMTLGLNGTAIWLRYRLRKRIKW